MVVRLLIVRWGGKRIALEGSPSLHNSVCLNCRYVNNPCNRLRLIKDYALCRSGCFRTALCSMLIAATGSRESRFQSSTALTFNITKSIVLQSEGSREAQQQGVGNEGGQRVGKDPILTISTYNPIKGLPSCNDPTILTTYKDTI